MRDEDLVTTMKIGEEEVGERVRWRKKRRKNGRGTERVSRRVKCTHSMLVREVKRSERNLVELKS